MMISLMNNSVEKSLDSQLWHACAGGMVQMPSLNSKVFYFPQGHAEHAALGNVNFGDFPKIPSYILCQVSAIKFMADADTDEVYVKMGLTPLINHDDFGGSFDHNDDRILGFSENDKYENDQENPTSFAKTLTQSDANNGGGFSVPRYCADTIFPKLNYNDDPPVQNIQAKDVHGKIWKFRHIYRGTPRRHLLTTGWSNFVNSKKLVAGDSIVFLRSDNGELCVGIRRANRGSNNNNGRLFGLAGESDDNNNNQFIIKNPKGKLSLESVIEAGNLAANGKPFEVFYYPRASTPEFCVKASTVMAAMRIQWCPGMRFKMPLETEDSSRISWFMGTISSVHVNDQIRWPNSPWRLLQVTWDEPDLLQNVKRVNPWLVEMVSNMPGIHLSSPFSPARKKPRIPQPLDFPLISSLTNIPTSIQGARHNNNNNNNSGQLGTDGNQNHPQLKKIPSFPFKMLNDDDPLVIEKQPKEITNENVSSLLTMGNSDYLHSSLKKNDEKEKKRPVFVLFGQPILTEQQLSESWSSDGSVVLQNGPVESSSDEAGPWLKQQKSDFGLQTGSLNGLLTFKS